MELKRWFVFARDKNGLERKFAKVPDFDSTKANFDELENENKKLRAMSTKMIKRFNSLCDLVVQMGRASEGRDDALQKRLDHHSKKIDDTKGRLAALEAKPCIDCNRCTDRFVCCWGAPFRTLDVNKEACPYHDRRA